MRQIELNNKSSKAIPFFLVVTLIGLLVPEIFFFVCINKGIYILAPIPLFASLIGLFGMLVLSWLMFGKVTISASENGLKVMYQYFGRQKGKIFEKDEIKKIVTMRDGVDADGHDSIERYVLIIVVDKNYKIVGQQARKTILELATIISDFLGVPHEDVSLENVPCKYIEFSGIFHSSDRKNILN